MSEFHHGNSVSPWFSQYTHNPLGILLNGVVLGEQRLKRSAMEACT